MAQLFNFLENRLKHIVFGFQVHDNLVKKRFTGKTYANTGIKDQGRAWTQVT